MILTILRTGQVYCRCPSREIHLMFFSWLDLSYGLEEVKCYFPQDYLLPTWFMIPDVDLDLLAEGASIRFFHREVSPFSLLPTLTPSVSGSYASPSFRVGYLQTAFGILLHWWFVSSYSFLYFLLSIIDIQHHVCFRCTTQWFDICIYWEIITTVSLVNICHHT